MSFALQKTCLLCYIKGRSELQACGFLQTTNYNIMFFYRMVALVSCLVFMFTVNMAWSLFTSNQTTDQKFTAGEFELVLTDTNNNEVVGLLTDAEVVPGTVGSSTVKLTSEGLDSWLCLNFQVEGLENSCNENEQLFDTSTSSNSTGELLENLNVVLALDGNEIFNGTADELESEEFTRQHLVDGSPQLFTVDYSVATSTDNRIMSDTATIQTEFSIVQYDDNLSYVCP